MALTNYLVEVDRIQFYDDSNAYVISPVSSQHLLIDANTYATKINPHNVEAGMRFDRIHYLVDDGHTQNNADYYKTIFTANWLNNKVPNIATPGQATWHPSTEYVEVRPQYKHYDNKLHLCGVSVHVVNKTTGSSTEVISFGDASDVSDSLKFNFMLGSYPPEEGAELFRMYWNNFATSGTMNVIMLGWQGQYDGSEPLCDILWATTSSSNPENNAGLTRTFDFMSSDVPTLKSLGLLKDKSFQTVVNDLSENAASTAALSLSKRFVTR